MKRILIATILVGAVSGSAMAADMAPRIYTKAPPPVVAPLFNWSGFYIGGHLGAGWSDQSATSVDPVSDPAAGSLRSGARLLGGGQVGYNWQFAPNWVLGVEGDITWTDLRATAFDTNRAGGVVLAGGVNFANKVDWLATIRGRLGFAVTPQFLLYGTGGAAWGEVNYNTVDIHAAGPAFPATFNFNGTRSGWVAGVGGEWAFTPNWIARVEYLHYDLQGASASGIPRVGFPGERSTFTYSDLRIDTVRAGVSYKFNPW